MLSNLTSNQSSLINPISQTPTLVPVNVVNPFQGASYVNGVIQLPQYQQILIEIPTIDLLKMQSQQQQQQSQSFISNSSQTSQSQSQFSNDRLLSRTAQYHNRLFDHLKTDLPVDVVSSF